MAQYTRNTFTVDALQYTGSNSPALRDFGITFTSTQDAFIVTATEGPIDCPATSYVVRFADGTIEVMTKAAFEANYTVVP